MSVVALARVVRNALKEEQDSVERGILAGVKDKDEYLQLVGKRQGLLLAIGTLDAEVQRFDEQN